MKIAAFIPARYAATRFPAKLMQQLGNKSVIRHTYDNTLATGLFDDVFGGNPASIFAVAFGLLGVIVLSRSIRKRKK